MTTCTTCQQRPVRHQRRGLCDPCYRRARRGGELAELEQSAPRTLRASESTWAAVDREAQRTGEAPHAVAVRWLAESASRALAAQLGIEGVGPVSAWLAQHPESLQRWMESTGATPEQVLRLARDGTPGRAAGRGRRGPRAR